MLLECGLIVCLFVLESLIIPLMYVPHKVKMQYVTFLVIFGFLGGR